MSDEDDAYKAAQRLIAKAKAEGAPVLSFGADETRALTRLPPEIVKLFALHDLDLADTQIINLQFLSELSTPQLPDHKNKPPNSHRGPPSPSPRSTLRFTSHERHIYASEHIFDRVCDEHEIERSSATGSANIGKAATLSGTNGFPLRFCLRQS